LAPGAVALFDDIRWEDPRMYVGQVRTYEDLDIIISSNLRIALPTIVAANCLGIPVVLDRIRPANPGGVLPTFGIRGGGIVVEAGEVR